MVNWVTLAMIVQAIVAVVWFGRNFPIADEWEFVPVYVGAESFWSWLWMQHNEHRLPLPRMIVWLAYQITHDYRSGSIIQIVLLGWCSLRMTQLIRERRGYARWVDVAVPVSLLHWGQAENLMMGYQVCFALTLALSISCLGLALQAPRLSPAQLRNRILLRMILLLLSGAFGILIAMGLSLWLMILTVKQPIWRERIRLLAVAALPLLYLSVYLIDYHKPGHHPPSAGILPSLAIAGQMQSMAFGISARFLHPVGMLLLGAMIGFAAVLAIRQRVWGWLGILAGGTLLAGAIGWGRSGFGDEMGYWARYGWLAWPTLGVFLLATIPYRWFANGVALLALGLFPFNTGSGYLWGTVVSEGVDAVRLAIDDGQSASEIAWTLMADSGQAERVERGLPLLLAAEQSRSIRVPIRWALLALAGVVGLWGIGLLHQIQCERAEEMFRLQRTRLSEQFRLAANANGIPRGLFWKRCEFVGDCQVFSESGNRSLIGLIEVIVEFEAIPDGGMEDVEAVPLPRQATACFVFVAGHWETTGQAWFNQTPSELIARWEGAEQIRSR
ncbi:hypothetical protein [Tuwongella immobilis]|nr:hypothetical protein [Tuwongella immobilis]